MTHLQMTPEDRLKFQAQAALTKEANKKWAEENLRNDFADENHWRMLSQEYSVRLPQWYIPCTETKYLKRALKKLNLDSSWWTDQTGCSNFKEFSDMNPKYPAYACVGIILEAYDYEMENK